MQIENLKVDVVCDIAGCNKIAKYYIKKGNTVSMHDNLKLCPTCASGLLKVLNKIFIVKEKKDVKNIK